jgi:hypothetical protein
VKSPVIPANPISEKTVDVPSTNTTEETKTQEINNSSFEGKAEQTEQLTTSQIEALIKEAINS